jgi:peptidoglycan/LPS O-acetylase OafA/YrhL
MSKLIYQPHIDGLRAVAVLSVLIYHINNSWLPGGFIGVDIFFVISGFLITKIISTSIIDGNFSLKIFYNRRIKRILPVYFLVSSVSICFAWLLFFPKDLIGFANSLLSSTFFISNFYFWKTSDYFSSAIELKPLVHTWSLSVEEQFYVFWPLTLAILYKFKSGISKKLSILIFIIISIFLSYLLSKSDPQFAYYSIATRGFELLVGAFAALYTKESLLKSKVLSYLGAILIVISFIVINKKIDFPGVIALIPCIGAVCIIVSAKSNTLINRILETKVAVSIGLISYSLYMWHWPILAFAKYYYTHLTGIHILLLVLLMFLLSYITRYTIEQKIMHAQYGLRKSLGYVFITPAIIFMLFAAYINFNAGVPTRFSAEERVLIEQTYSNRHACSKERFILDFDDECFIKSFKTNNKKILLWGDSHANHFSGFFEEVAKHEAVDVYKMSFPGCPPIAGVYRINRTYSESCYLHNFRVQELLLNTNNFDYVALAANWSNYPLGANLADDDNKEISISNSKRAFYNNLQKQLELFSSKGIKVIFLDSVPNFKSNASQCQLKNIIFGYPKQQFCERSLMAIKKERLAYDYFIKNVISATDNIFVLDFMDFFCRKSVCKTLFDGEMMYRDQNHITDSASRSLYQRTFKDGRTLLAVLND